MSSSKLDAKHERTLRTLLKQPDNRRCAVCETLGPQYVVINFSMFVCTNCSGVHRQFNHRCKGISMATFKPEEMRAIEEGGNAIAAHAQIALARYLAKWSPSDLPKPTDRTVSKVRDFIEIVFVKKRFADEHAPVPGGLARLPARPRGPRHCARLAPLPSRLQRAAGAARRPGAAPRAPAVPVRWQPEPAESGGAARAVHQQRAVVHVAGNRCGGAATRAVRRSGACASAPLLAR